MELKDLVGLHVLQGIEVGTTKLKRFFYDECNFVKFTLDGVTYLALENPDDGYRTYMEELEIVDEPCKFALPDINVLCKMREQGKYTAGDNVLSFVDVKCGKEILAIGTENNDDYYPLCIMEYKPENMACNSEKEAE